MDHDLVHHPGLLLRGGGLADFVMDGHLGESHAAVDFDEGLLGLPGSSTLNESVKGFVGPSPLQLGFGPKGFCRCKRQCSETDVAFLSTGGDGEEEVEVSFVADERIDEPATACHVGDGLREHVDVRDGSVEGPKDLVAFVRGDPHAGGHLVLAHAVATGEDDFLGLVVIADAFGGLLDEGVELDAFSQTAS